MEFDAAFIFRLIDLTSLNETDNAATIAALCQKAVSNVGHVAAVCVYPQFVNQAKTLLADTSVKIATVANFPHAKTALEKTTQDIKQAIEQGADEIDVVFPYPDYFRGEKNFAYDYIRACKATCGENSLLKVILETGALKNLSDIAEVSYEVCHAGADFLKTSTGKISVGATLEATEMMLQIIKKIPRSIGLKVSGGVRTIEQAQQYIQLSQKMMGSEWVSPKHFRIGASQLVDHYFI